MLQSSLLLLLLLPSLALSVSLVVSTQTPFGEIEGFVHAVEKDVPTYIFLGIRYGQAPDGQSRFKKPKMVEKWFPLMQSAKRFGAACLHTSFMLPGETYSEDCLFLNVITPSLTTDAKLPVLVFIHGGGFQLGAASMFGYKRLAERVAAEGIVVVTINYRLGPLGFFSLGDSVAPGNMGLWDQTLALQFLQEVLPSFGGDPSRITVGGQSAGSCSVSALQFSPHSSSLFSQALLMSGSMTAEWALSESTVDESKKLASELGCLSESSAETISCLQKKTADDIKDAESKLYKASLMRMAQYHPRLDGDFFPHTNIERLVKEAPKKRTLNGVTDQESATFTMYAFTGLALKDRESYTREQLIEYINNEVATEEEHHESAAEFRRKLIEFYVEKDEKKGDAGFYVQRYTELVSDLQFLMPLYQETQLKLANSWPTYLYILQHVTKSFPRGDWPVTGTYHGDELEHFVNQIVFHPLKADEPEDHAFGANFVSTMVNFVKNGDPSSSSFSWLPVTNDHPFQHASITTNMSLKKEAYRAEAIRLWLEKIPQIVSAANLRKSRLPGAEALIVHTEL